MPNWCRNLVLAVGDEAELSRFVDFTVTETAEETAFTEKFETGVWLRESGALRIEVISRCKPPLDDLVELSRKFPTLKLAVEWEQAGDQICGCASIANGNAELACLDGDVYGDIEEEGEYEYEMMMLRFETMRETSRLLFGPDWREEGGPWNDDSRRFRDAAQQIANSACAERAERGPWGDVSMHFREAVRQIANAAFAEWHQTHRHDSDERNSQWKREGF